MSSGNMVEVVLVLLLVGGFFLAIGVLVAQDRAGLRKKEDRERKGKPKSSAARDDA